MLTKGIKSNKLVSDLFEGVTKNVPVGQTPLTNSFEKNNPNVYPQNVGQPLTYLSIDDFEAIGSENDTKTLARNEAGNSIEYTETAPYNDEALIDGAFDDSTGTFNIIKRDGSVLKISGFLTQADFGVGAAGSRGNLGLDGLDGEDGFDGDDGDDGCGGTVGAEGEEGTEGDDGKDGPPGIPGPIGQTGNPGVRGPVGKKGKTGYEGSRGQKGLSCGEESAGAPGAEGEPPNEAVVVSSTAPTDNSLMWGKL